MKPQLLTIQMKVTDHTVLLRVTQYFVQMRFGRRVLLSMYGKLECWDLEEYIIEDYRQGSQKYRYMFLMLQ